MTGYQISKYNFAEIGIGAKDDKLIGNKLSTIIWAISNEFKINREFIWD